LVEPLRNCLQWQILQEFSGCERIPQLRRIEISREVALIARSQVELTSLGADKRDWYVERAICQLVHNADCSSAARLDWASADVNRRACNGLGRLCRFW